MAIIGAGPAGLMAAEVLVQGGARVDVFDAMPSAGRKFLLAGRGGLNLTHAEAQERFVGRYGAGRADVEPLLDRFGPADLQAWVKGLGIDTFVGSSGRVFPTGMKSSPLLRAWLQRLRGAGVGFYMRHRWLGWQHEGADAPLLFTTRVGELEVHADATVLALGGASWPRMGSDGAWVALLRSQGVTVAPLRSANCGFDVQWSEYFRNKFAGQPVKTVAVSFLDTSDKRVQQQGEFTITQNGVEGSLIYSVSAQLRDRIEAAGDVVLYVDLAPDWTAQQLADEISRPRGSSSWSRHLSRRIGLVGVKAALLREHLMPPDFDDTARLVATIKELPLRLIAPRPIAEAISSAGGVAFSTLDEWLMVRTLPGLFCAGEMLDWEAPTGGYLLTACFASGHVAGNGALKWLEQRGAG